MGGKLKIKGINAQKVRKIFITAGLSLGIMASMTGCKDEKSSAGYKTKATLKPIEKTKELSKEEKLQQDIEDNIKTSEDILNDMKKRYLEKYNKENNTNYKVENLKLIKSSTDYIIITKDGTIYTHGLTPDVLFNELEKQGIKYNTNKYNSKIYKSLNEDEILEQMLSDGTPVLDGNNLQNIGKEIKNSTLSDFIDVFDIGIELKNNFTTENFKKYEDSLIKFYYGEEDKEKNDKSNTNNIKKIKGEEER